MDMFCKSGIFDLGVMVTQEMSEVFKNNYKDLVEQETYYHPNWEKLGLV